MLNTLQNLFAPPIFEDEEKTRVASLLNSILWAVIIIGSIYAVIAPVLLGQYFSAMLTGSIVVFGIIARMLMTRGYVNAASVILLIALTSSLLSPSSFQMGY